MKIIARVLLLVVLAILAVAAYYFATRLEWGTRPEAPDMTASDDVSMIEANGVRFAYIEEGEGPLVLLFHGYPETARSWKAVQKRIAEAGFRTIAVFMRGYPPSAAGDDYSVRTLGKDIVALIDAFGAAQATIIGHDWGASAVYEAAFVAPDKVSHLVAISIPHPAGIEVGPDLLMTAPHFLYYLAPWADRLVWSHDYRHVERIYQTWSPDFAVPDSELDDVKKTLGQPGAIKSVLDYYRTLAENGEANGELDSQGQITVPTLVMAGDRDGTIILENFETARKGFAGDYRFELITGAGHFPQLEDPATVSDLVIDFIDDK